LRGENGVFEQGRDDASGLTLTGADDVGDIAARQLATVEYRLEDGT
jgi:hypothetical protein